MKTSKPPSERDRKVSPPEPTPTYAPVRHSKRQSGDHAPSESNRESSRELQSPKFGLFHFMRTLSWMTTGATLVVGGIVMLGVWRSGNDFLDKLSTLFNPPAEQTKIDVRSMVVQQIRSSSELTTATFSMETVVPARRDRTLGDYVVGSTTLLYIAYGEVRAGVDLSAIKPENVQLIGKTVQLQLPAPRILDTKIDVNRSRVYDYDRGFMSLGPDVAPELQEMAQRETLSKLNAAACSQGLLQLASDRAKLTVSQLLSVAGYANLTVEIAPPSADACTIANPPSHSTDSLNSSEPSVNSSISSSVVQELPPAPK